MSLQFQSKRINGVVKTSGEDFNESHTNINKRHHENEKKLFYIRVLHFGFREFVREHFHRKMISKLDERVCRNCHVIKLSCFKKLLWVR